MNAEMYKEIQGKEIEVQKGMIETMSFEDLKEYVHLGFRECEGKCRFGASTLSEENEMYKNTERLRKRFLESIPEARWKDLFDIYGNHYTRKMLVACKEHSDEIDDFDLFYCYDRMDNQCPIAQYHNDDGLAGPLTLAELSNYVNGNITFFLRGNVGYSHIAAFTTKEECERELERFTAPFTILGLYNVALQNAETVAAHLVGYLNHNCLMNPYSAKYYKKFYAPRWNKTLVSVKNSSGDDQYRINSNGYIEDELPVGTEVIVGVQLYRHKSGSLKFSLQSVEIV